MKKISHSAWKTYLDCPKKYDYHYNEKDRPNETSSALQFGLAIDEALNSLLLGKAEPLGVFQKHFTFESLENASFGKKDLQLDVFTDEQIESIKTESIEYQTWACLRVKGRMLIEEYMNQVYPLIEEVHSIQEKLDDRPGVLDAIVTLKGYGKVLIDHKTSSEFYLKNAIETDTQLALYASSTGMDKVGFVVLNKNISFIKTCTKCGKDSTGTQYRTCPANINEGRCHGSLNKEPDRSRMIQIIVGNSPKINQKLINESINEVQRAIEAKIYPRNLKNCQKMYGKPCPYLEKCWKK